MTYATTFSGIGGWELGLDAAGWQLRWQCECDPFCRALLTERFGVPVYDDIRTLLEHKPEPVDCLVGSPPCQPFSVAGKKHGVADTRHLYPAFIGAVRVLKPRWVLMENVAGLLHDRGAFGQYIGGLAALGYDLVWHSIPACAVGANHQRDRVWIIAHTRHTAGRTEQRQPCKTPSEKSDSVRSTGLVSNAPTEHGPVNGRKTSEPGRLCENVPDSASGRLETGNEKKRSVQIVDSRSDVPDASGTGEKSAQQSGHRNVVEQSGSHVPDPAQHLRGTQRHEGSETFDGRSDGRNTELEGLEGRRVRRAVIATDNWAVEPDVGRAFDGFSAWLDENMTLLSQSHKSLLTYAGTESRSSEVLRELCVQTGEENIQRPSGGSHRISASEVLFAYLCKLKEASPSLGNVPLEGEEVRENTVRGVRNSDKPPGASLRPKPQKQRTDESANPLQTLSRLLAFDAETAWSRYRRSDAPFVLNAWGQDFEDGFQRVANGISNRVDRLKALGNAVVPQIPFIIAQAINEIEGMK